jgi:hypothetical protein
MYDRSHDLDWSRDVQPESGCMIRVMMCDQNQDIRPES